MAANPSLQPTCCGLRPPRAAYTPLANGRSTEWLGVMSIAARAVVKFLQDVLKFLRDINPQSGGGSGGDDAQPFVPSDRLRRRLNSPVTLGPLMPQWTMSRILEASPISLGKFSGKLFVYSFFSYCAAALVWWVWSSFLESPLKDPLRETA